MAATTGTYGLRRQDTRSRVTTAQTDTDHSLEQQFAKMKEEADKRLQEAQENASREAERQESIKELKRKCPKCTGVRIL